MPFQIALAATEGDSARKSAATYLAKLIQRHVAQREEPISNGRILVAVHKIHVDDSGNAVLRASVVGEIEGQPLQVKYRGRRQTTGTTVTGAAFGGLLGEVVLSGAKSVLTKSLGGSDSRKNIQQLLNEAAALACLKMDQALGVEESTAAKWWALISKIRWAPLVVIPIISAFVIVTGKAGRGQAPGLGMFLMSLLGGLIPALRSRGQELARSAKRRFWPVF